MSRALTAASALMAVVAGLVLVPLSHVHRPSDGTAVRHVHLDSHASSRAHHDDATPHDAHDEATPHDHDGAPVISAADEFVFNAAQEPRRSAALAAAHAVQPDPQVTAIRATPVPQPPAHGPPDARNLPVRAPPSAPAFEA